MYDMCVAFSHVNNNAFGGNKKTYFSAKKGRKNTDIANQCFIESTLVQVRRLFLKLSKQNFTLSCPSRRIDSASKLRTRLRRTRLLGHCTRKRDNNGATIYIRLHYISLYHINIILIVSYELRGGAYFLGRNIKNHFFFCM